MIRTAVLLAIFAALAAATAGVMAGKDGAEDTGLVIASRQNAPVAPKPGSGIAAAAVYLAGLNPPPPPPPPPAPPPPVITPGPVIALNFRRELAAVIGTGAERYLLMKANGVGVARALRRDEIYMDGWRLTALNETEATLTKGNEAQTVYLYAAAEPPLQAAPVAPTITAASLGMLGLQGGGRGAAAPAPGRGGAPVIQATPNGGFVVQGGAANVNAQAGRGGAPQGGGAQGGGRGGGGRGG